MTQAVHQAEALAQDVGADIATVLLTHFADADTLDTLRPGGPDLATTTAINRAVAAELAAQGVEIFVQLADRAAFRRWMQDREDTPQARRGWIDRARLLHGAEAFRALGLKPPPKPAPPRFAPAPGPIADRLITAFLNDDDSTGFDELAEALLAAARGDVLDLAVRKTAERHGDEDADALELELVATAQAARIGPSGWTGLITLPVALAAGTPPDAEAMGAALIGSGIPADTAELRFLPGWRSPDTLTALSPLAVRRVLLDLVAGREPRDLPPADTDDLAARGFGILLGVEIDWDIPIWDEIAATGLPDDDEETADDATPDQTRRAALFDGWRSAVFDASGGCVPLTLAPPSDLIAVIAEFLEEAGQHTDGIDEIRETIAMARSEAGGEEVVCRAEIVGTGLELSLYAASGRFLDSLTLTADRMPAPPEEMLRVIGTFVRLVRDAPG